VNPISNKPYSLYNWSTGWTGCAISSSHSSTAENTGWRGYEKISSKDVRVFLRMVGCRRWLNIRFVMRQAARCRYG